MEKFLPIGIQNFEQMINGNFVYVDKTKYIYDIVRVPQGFYFLSRPRRFGKLLLVSTLRALFEGKKELFKNLWIEKQPWDWKEHSIIVFDFSGISSGSPEALRNGILKRIQQIANENDLDFQVDMIPESFRDLILKMHRKNNTPVVVLIDEYDKPIIEHLGRGPEHREIASENRYVLKPFYGVLKDADVSAVLRFVFLTGISKFSQVSIFSDLNNLIDLSMQDAFGPILGYTENELKTNFSQYIEKLANKFNVEIKTIFGKIQEWYNGYRFADQDVKIYNPFSILNLFYFHRFKNYWFKTATPTFLIGLLKEKKYPVPEIEKLKVSEMHLSTYDLDYLELEPLLFQTGYITILDIEDEMYKLGFPNYEVRTSFLDFLIKNLLEVTSPDMAVQLNRLNQYLSQEQIDSFIETVNAILSSIPYQHIYDQDEHYYHTVFYLMLSASGASVRTEVLTALGRIDMEIHFQDKIYIIELKCNQTSEKALQQIRDKKYFEKHLNLGKKIILMGINFSTRDRRILDWKMEMV